MKLSHGFSTLLSLSVTSLVPSAQGGHGPDRPQQPLVTTLSLDRVVRGDVGGVSVDDAGVIYVADFDRQVYRITQDGTVRILADSFACTSGNTIAPNGKLLQCDFMLDTISEVDVMTGEVTLLVTAGLADPVGIVTAPDGTMFVCNCGDDTIARVRPGDDFATLFASGPDFDCPNGIAMDPFGNLYVVSFFGERIPKIDPSGAVLPFAKFARRGNAHIVFAGPGRRDLYFTNYIRNQVFRISRTGSVTLVAGSGQRDLIDGFGTDAAFRRPNGIAVDRTGALFLNNTLSMPGGFRPIDIRRIVLPAGY